jgi:hypothetical protein
VPATLYICTFISSVVVRSSVSVNAGMSAATSEVLVAISVSEGRASRREERRSPRAVPR